MLIVVDVILIDLNVSFISEEAEPRRARRGAGTSIFAAYFSKKNPSSSTVPASGASRRDPPRHVDVSIQILIKIRLM